MTNDHANEFTAFLSLAVQLLSRHTKKNAEYSIDFDNSLGNVIALYMMGRVSRFAVCQYLTHHWIWDKQIDSLTLTEILAEADKYKPDYRGVHDGTDTRSEPS